VAKNHKKDEWLRDIEARQRNIVFPDTAANEGRFWRNLYEGKQKLTRLQAVGIAIMAIMAATLFILVSLGWGHDRYPTWAGRIGSAALDWILAFGVLGGFLLLLKWGTRQKTQKR